MTKNWRSRSQLEANLFDIRMCCTKVLENLDDFIHFAAGCFANSRKSGLNELISKRLAHLIRPLRNSQQMLQQAFRNLETKNWQAAFLVRDGYVSLLFFFRFYF